MTKAEELLEHANGGALIADTGYDADTFVREVRRPRMKVVISCHPKRKRKRRLDKKLYRRRYKVECSFHHLKRFRAVASRYDKTATNFLATVEIACAWQWLKWPPASKNGTALNLI